MSLSEYRTTIGFVTSRRDSDAVGVTMVPDNPIRPDDVPDPDRWELIGTAAVPYKPGMLMLVWTWRLDVLQ
jgi:hypothetical protein